MPNFTCVLLSAYPVTSTSEILPATIIASNPTGLFTHHNHAIRESIDDLSSHPLYSDDNSTEIPIYNSDGRRVSRVLSTVDEDAPRCGIMLNLLPLARDLTEDPDTNAVDFDDDNRTTRRHTPNTYPQAFLASAGFLYSNHPLQAFAPVLDRINTEVAIQEDVETDDGDIHTNTAKAVVNLKYQAYSEAVHRMSPRHNDHTIAHGMVTAAAAGFMATSDDDRIKAATHLREVGLTPFQILERKLTARESRHEPSPADIRLEALYCIDMALLRPDHRNGR